MSSDFGFAVSGGGKDIVSPNKAKNLPFALTFQHKALEIFGFLNSKLM